VPVIRSVLRIELRSTKQLMIWTLRASGTRFTIVVSTSMRKFAYGANRIDIFAENW
jgi:hypothetical protein